MHLHPDTAAPLVQFEGPGPTRPPKMPVMATDSPREFALAPRYEASAATLSECLFGAELEIDLKAVT